MINVNPTFAFQLAPSVSVGVGVNYVNLLNTTAKSQLNINGALMDGSSDATSDLSGHGSGWGYNFGAQFKPVEHHSFGLAYRSKVQIPIRGNLVLTNLSSSAQFAGNFNDSTYTTDATSSLTLPATILAGYAFQMNPKWTLLADYQWTQWNVFETQRVALSETDPQRLGFVNGGSNEISTSRNWRNTSSIALGANYKHSDTWQWRTGYAFYQRTVPAQTFSPDVPDAAVHVLALGFSRTWGQFILDFAFNEFLVAKRDIENTVGNSVGASVNGTYRTLVPLFGLNATYKFD
jgi:long-chain fatty acid transport protein